MAIGRNHSPSVIGLGSNIILPLLAMALILSLGICSLTYGAIVPKSTSSNSGDEKSLIQQKVMNLQIPFVANQGQVKDKNVRFHAQTMGGAVYITQDGQMAYFFPNKKSSQGLIVKESLVNSIGINLMGSDPSKAKVNYIIGNDSKEWKTGLDTFNALSFGQVYQGVDLKLKAHGNTIEKIFTVQPGADPQAIQLTVFANDGLSLNESGELEARFGKEKISFSRPIAFQEINGGKTSVTVAYQLRDGGYGFKVGKYDTAHPLIIDPSLVYVSYLGGESDDVAYDIAVDDDSFIYIAGTSYSTSVSYYEPNGDQTHFEEDIASSGADAFVFRADKDGTELDFTFLGGTEDDFCYGMALRNGKVYLTGQTQSKKFPTKVGAYDRKIGGGVDAWFAVLDANNLSNMITGSYLGGGGADSGLGVAVDSDGNVYVVGETLSSSFPVPDPNVPFASSKGGVDAFVAKFGPTSIGPYDLVYSTFIGGNGDDSALDIAVTDTVDEENDERIYVTGQTASPDLYTSDDSFVSTLNGVSDAYLAIFQYDPETTRLVIDFLSYLGGTGQDSGEAIVLDGGDVYIGGWTDSSGGTDGFVTRINEADDGTITHSCTVYLDNSSDDRIYDIALGSNQNLIAVGETESINLDGTTDIFIAEVEMDADGTCVPAKWIYTNGGSDSDVGNAISLDVVGNIYLAGTSYGFDGQEISNQDAFLAMLCEDNDADGVCNLEDNCPDIPNGPLLGSCTNGDENIVGNPCFGETREEANAVCGNNGVCSMGQENFDESDEDGDKNPFLGDACDPDADGDGMPNWWELKFGLNPLYDDSGDDLDDDGLINLGEYENDTDPTDKDTDDDLMWDGWEVDYRLDPLFNDANIDDDDYIDDAVVDKDGWTHLQEYQAQTDPRDKENHPGKSAFIDGIWVSPLGDDDHLGSTHHPVRTLHEAVDRLNLLDKDTYDVYIKELSTGETYNTSYEGDDFPLVLLKHTTLRFIAVGDVVIDGTDPENSNNGIILSSGLSTVTLEGIKLHFFNTGIKIDESNVALNLNNVEIKNCIQSGIDTGLQDYISINMTTSQVSDCTNGVIIGVDGKNISITGGQVLRSSQTGVIVSGGESEINGLQVLDGTGTGILIEGSDNAITDGIVSGNDNGVVVAASALDTTITNIEISNNTNTGLTLSGDRSADDTDNEVDSAVISGNAIGILVEGANYTIAGGNVSTNGNGITVDASALNNTISSSITVNNNTINGMVINGDGTSVNSATLSGNVQNGIIVSAAKGVAITDSTITGPAVVEEGSTGISVGMGTEDLDLSGGLTAATISGYDIGMKVTVDAACINLSDVQITSCGTGMKLVEAMQAKIDMGEYEAQSEIYACDTGIEITGASVSSVIKNGIVWDNFTNGIVVDSSSEFPEGIVLESMKVIDNQGTGIELLAGFNHQIINSVITGNNAGVPATGLGGIAIIDSTAVLRWNEIHSNYCWDVYVDDALAGSPIDARFNWWGDEAGPTGKVGEYLFYEPVLPYRDEWIGLPLQDDFDEDGLGDQWEVANGLDPYDLDNPDGEALFDDTGLTNRQAYQ